MFVNFIQNVNFVHFHVKNVFCFTLHFVLRVQREADITKHAWETPILIRSKKFLIVPFHSYTFSSMKILTASVCIWFCSTENIFIMHIFVQPVNVLINVYKMSVHIIKANQTWSCLQGRGGVVFECLWQYMHSRISQF